MQRHVSFTPHIQAIKCRLHRLSRELIAAVLVRTIHWLFMYIKKLIINVNKLCILVPYMFIGSNVI
jgi:hypothetical protein